jgi:hypothetical protein
MTNNLYNVDKGIIFMVMKNRDLFTYELTKMDDGTIRIIFSINDREQVILYYEKSKRKWVNKPLTMDGWRCVDGKVIIPDVYEDNNIEPKDFVMWGQEIIHCVNKSTQ